MNTYLIKNEQGREYMVGGETAREAAYRSLKYIEKVMEGCTVKRISVMPAGGCKYKLRVEYYGRTAYNVRRLKNKPEILSAEFEMELIEPDK